MHTTAFLRNNYFKRLKFGGNMKKLKSILLLIATLIFAGCSSVPKAELNPLKQIKQLADGLFLLEYTENVEWVL